jgi:hypothetical protein
MKKNQRTVNKDNCSTTIFFSKTPKNPFLKVSKEV